MSAATLGGLPVVRLNLFWQSDNDSAVTIIHISERTLYVYVTNILVDHASHYNSGRWTSPGPGLWRCEWIRERNGQHEQSRNGKFQHEVVDKIPLAGPGRAGRHLANPAIPVLVAVPLAWAVAVALPVAAMEGENRRNFIRPRSRGASAPVPTMG